MIESEELVCRIPNESAIKLHKIYCSTQPTNYPEILGDVATWCGVFLTLVMAYFAYRAWRTSQTQLRITRDIALNEQRIPALMDFFESIDQRMGSAHDLAEDEINDKSLKVVLRNHDRWTLTYPEIYKDGHLRKALTTLHSFTRMYHVFRTVEPRIYLDTEAKLDEFNRAKTKSQTSLDKHLSQLRTLCLQLHNNEISVDKTNTDFRQLSVQVEDDFNQYSKVFPFWRMVGHYKRPGR